MKAIALRSALLCGTSLVARGVVARGREVALQINGKF